MRKVFVDDLPRKYGIGTNKNKLVIDWLNSIGYKVRFIYDDIEGWIEILDYQRNKKLIIKYKNKIIEMNAGNFNRGKLGNLLNIMTSDFKFEIEKRLIDCNKDGFIKRDLTIIDRKKVQSKTGQWLKYYKVKCNKCGFDGGKHFDSKNEVYKDEYWILESGLLNGYKCACCSNPSCIVVKNINSIYHTDKWMIPYIGEECAKTHTCGSHDKIQVTCPDCGRTKNIMIKTIHRRHSIGCKCGDGYSYGHKYIFNLLTQLKQEFIDNHTFDWCKFYNTYKNKETTGEYDFVLEDIKIIIEVDGDFHRKDNDMNGQTKEESKAIDDEKDRLAQKHGYRVIRISDEGNFKENTIDKLKNIFDFNNIDWIKCEEFALNNLVKIACNYKRNNQNLFATDIANIVNLSSTTVRRYLQKGSYLNWCNYNSKEEQIKNNKCQILRNKENISKPIKMFDKDMNFIKMFLSATECEKLSEKTFRVKLNHKNISATCLGTQNIHKGYIFKFATKEEYKEWLKEQNKLIKLHNENLGQAS